MKKRLFSLALALCMVLSLLPFGVSAAQIVKSGACGENLTWTLDSDGTLRISGNGEMYDWTYDAPWSDAQSSIKTVIIENGVTSIGSSAFDNCTGMTSVTIPSSVKNIWGGAFQGCISLTAVHISDLAAWCRIFFESEVANPLYYAHNLYLNGTLISDLKIPSGVKSIRDYAFDGGWCLASVTIPSSVTSIGCSAFSGSGIKSVTIPSGVTSIEDRTFYNCGSLTSVTIPSSVTSIGNYAFYWCTGLTSVKIPSGVTSIGDHAFEYCTGLKSVTIPSSVTNIGDAAFDCTDLEGVYISDLAAWCRISFESEAANPLYYAHNLYLNGTLIRDLIIPEGVTEIWNYAFYDCDGLTSVTIPEGMTEIWSYAFYDCDGLKSVTIPSSVTEIELYAFDDCTSLQNVYYGGSSEQWNGIPIYRGNDPLKNATIHYNSSGPQLPKITTQPKDVTVAVGGTAKFTVQATGDDLTYQWQYSKDGSNWVNSTAASAKTAKFTTTVKESFDGRLYRCVVTDSNGKQAISNIARLTVKSGPQITAQPQNAAAADGQKATFSVTATGVGLTYQWQYSKDGSNWVNSTAASAKTAKLTITAKTSFDGRLYRCVVTDANGKQAISNIARLTVKSGPQITAQLQSASAADGEKVTFSVKATGVGLTYQWQYSTNNGATWKNSTATSAKTAKLTITAKTSFDGRLYRCVVTDANGKTAASDPAKLTVRTPLKITAHPKSTSAAAGEKVTFSVKAAGDGLTYQWQYSKDGSNWTNSTAASGKTASLSFTMKAAFDGRLYRCVVKDSAGNQKISNAAFLQLAD